MFEKEATEYADLKCGKDNRKTTGWALTQDDFQKGAEFGYNKANEWHYPSKGEYPEEYEDILICYLTEDDGKDCVRGWYEYDFDNDEHIFKYINLFGTLDLPDIIAWKELVLPELKENEK